MPPKPSRNPLLAIVGEGPGKDEERAREPFVGQSWEARLAPCFDSVSVARRDLYITNATLCRPRRKLSAAEWNTALRCCRPRLEAELRLAPRIALALGTYALRTLTGKPPSIFDWQGAPLAGAIWKPNGQPWKPLKKAPEPGPETLRFDHLTVLASLHPAFTLPHRSPHYTPVLLQFVQRAVALARGELAPWQWPRVVVSETAGEPELLAALAEMAAAPGVAIDVETAGREPLRDSLLNVGFSTDKLMVSVFWPDATATVQAATKEACGSSSEKYFWNRTFDQLSLRTHGIQVGGKPRDLMLAHQVFAPRVSHKLSDAASFEFHAPRWKTVFRQTSDHGGAERFLKADPVERATYNAQDCAVTFALAEASRYHLARIHRGVERYESLESLTDVAMEMRLTGVGVSQDHVEAHRIPLEAQRQDALGQVSLCAEAAGLPGYRLGSFPQTRQLFLELLQAPVRKSKDGRVTFDEKVLQEYCTLGGQTAAMSRAILGFRKSKKQIDYLDALSGLDRVHPSWSPGRAKTGRWASQWPNLMNIPRDKVAKDGTIKVKGLRDCFCAAQGNALVEADFSALEARIVALISGDETLLQWFTDGVDIHRRTASLMFGIPEASVGSDLREQAKTTRYAFQYGAAPETAWRNAVVEFPKLTLMAVMQLFRKLRELHPAIVAYHATALKQAREDDYVEDPLSGRRYFFHGSVDPNQVYNLPIQTFGSELINRAMLRLRKLLPSDALVLQVHDSLVTEGPDPDALALLMKQEMERPVEIAGKVLPFPVDVKVGSNWGEMKKVKVAA